jgi:hypothetical protein
MHHSSSEGKGRAVLFIVDNIWETSERAFDDWIGQIRLTGGQEGAVLFSSRTPLGAKDIKFTPLQPHEATVLFKPQLREAAEFTSHSEWAKTILDGCAGLPLALSMAAAYLGKDPKGWQSWSGRVKQNSVRGKNKIPGHRGLPFVFEASLDWLEIEGRPGGLDECKYSWTDIFLSLSVIDPSSAGVPISVLAPMWGICVEYAEAACVRLANISLATISAGAPADREIKLHDLQMQYCIDQCNQTVAENAPSCWRSKALMGLIDDLSAPSRRASLCVEAFCAMDYNEEYWLSHFVYHLCRIDNGVLIAKDVVKDYRWVREVTERGSLADVARHIDQVLLTNETLYSGLKLRASKENQGASSKSKEVIPSAGAISESDVEGLRQIAFLFRHEIPPRSWIAREGVLCPSDRGGRWAGTPRCGLLGVFAGRRRRYSCGRGRTVE